MPCFSYATKQYYAKQKQILWEAAAVLNIGWLVCGLQVVPEVEQQLEMHGNQASYNVF